MNTSIQTNQSDDTIQQAFYDLVSGIATFNLGKTVWNEYQSFVIPKIAYSIVVINGVIHMVPQMSDAQLRDELATVQKVEPMVNLLKTITSKIDSNDADFTEFVSLIINFFSTIEQLKTVLEDARMTEDRKIFHSSIRRKPNPAFKKYIEK